MKYFSMLVFFFSFVKYGIYGKQKLTIGFAPTAGMTYPASGAAEDIEAARESLFALPDLPVWTWNVAWWSDPVIFGKYPEEGLVKYEKYLPKITDDDMKLIFLRGICARLKRQQGKQMCVGISSGRLWIILNGIKDIRNGSDLFMWII